MKKLVLFCCLLIFSMIVNAHIGIKKKAINPPLVNQQINDKEPLEKKKLKIFLKLDDFDAKNGISGSIPTMDYLLSKKIKAAIGFIALRCDASTLSVYAPYLNGENNKGEKLFEVWHHGLDHINPEFDGKDYDYQKTHFEQADQLIKELLRLQMHSFGSPFNHNDITTNTVIAENTNYKVTMFNKPAADSKTGILNLDNRVNMEIATGKPNYEAFVKNYNNKKGSFTNYMTLQGHPRMWKAEELNEFTQIIDFLITEGCEFDLPYDYYQSLKSEESKPKKDQKINFEILTVKVVGALDFEPQAKASSGLKVLYNSSNPLVATILEGKIHITGVGSTQITASQAGNSKFGAANYISQVLKVTASK